MVYSQDFFFIKKSLHLILTLLPRIISIERQNKYMGRCSVSATQREASDDEPAMNFVTKQLKNGSQRSLLLSTQTHFPKCSCDYWVPKKVCNLLDDFKFVFVAGRTY